ncbi:MAG: hypothetical protein AAF438_14070 [Pseudomonadota bacterium]
MTSKDSEQFVQQLVNLSDGYRRTRAPEDMLSRVLRNVPQRSSSGLGLPVFAGLAATVFAALVFVYNQSSVQGRSPQKYPSFSMIKMPSRSEIKVPSTVSVPISPPSVPVLPRKPKPVEKSQTKKQILNYFVDLKERYDEINNS